MKHIFSAVGGATLLFGASSAFAATFTPNFSDYPFPGTQFNVDAAANTYYHDNYGIDISNAYLYKDSRDTFDGIGIANGLVAHNFLPNEIGRIDFADKTDFVTFDYLAIKDTTFHAFASDGTELASFLAAPGVGTETFSSGGAKLISYFTFSTDGGFGTVSSLSYNFDGKTDGTNTDIPTVPEPESLALLLAGLVTVGAVARRKAA